MSQSHENPATPLAFGGARSSLIVMAFLLAGSAGLAVAQSAAEEGRLVPPPTLDEPAAQGTNREIVVLAGGCFWGVQGVFQHVKGVTNAVSGYAGGEKATAEYERVGTGTTGHAESVRITFDPSQISYGQILQLYFSVAHDPTELNRQGPDIGTQYRSTIFPANAEQERVAEAYVAQLNQAQVFDAAIATTIEPGQTFYPAEDYHQDFLSLHPTHPYVVYYDLPKIEDLKNLFPDLYRAEPVLVAAARQLN